MELIRSGNIEIRKDLMQDYDGNILDQETVLSARAELENQLNINFSWDNSHKHPSKDTLLKISKIITLALVTAHQQNFG